MPTHPDPGSDPIMTLSGDLVGLGPLDRRFLPDYHRWANDAEVNRGIGLGWPEPMERTVAAYDERVRAPDEVWFTVIERATGRAAGLVWLYEVAARQRRAALGIMLGSEADRGRGLGTEAVRLTLAYAFDGLGLSNVMLTVYPHNTRAIRAYEKAGFREFGRRHRSSVLGQRVVDLVYMEALADEWTSQSAQLP